MGQLIELHLVFCPNVMGIRSSTQMEAYDLCLPATLSFRRKRLVKQRAGGLLVEYISGVQQFYI